MNSGGFFGKPFASGAAPSGGLFFGENDGAVGLAGFAELHGHRVGRIDFEEGIDAARGYRERAQYGSRWRHVLSRGRPERAAFRSSARAAGGRRRSPWRSSRR